MFGLVGLTVLSGQGAANGRRAEAGLAGHGEGVTVALPARKIGYRQRRDRRVQNKRVEVQSTKKKLKKKTFETIRL